MMTLPAGWENYIDGSFQTAIMIRVTTIDGTVLRFSTVETDGILSWTGDRYEEGLLAKGGLGKLAYSVNVDQGGNIARVGEFRFVLLNQDNYWDILNGYDLLNSEVVVKRFILEVEPTEFDDGLTRFTGRISARTYDRNNIYITCDHDETEHRTLPKKTIDNEIFPDFDIPDNSNGKRIPMLFGHMEKAEAFFCNNHTETLYGPSVVTEGGQWIRDDNASWDIDEFIDKDLEIVGGPGKGQIVAIESNTDVRIYPYDYLQTPSVTDQSLYKITDTQFDMVLSDRNIFGFLDELNAVVSGQDGITQACWFWDFSAKIYVRMNQNVLSYLNNSSPFSSLAGLRFLAGVVKANNITFFYPYVFIAISNSSGWVDPENVLIFNNTTAATFHVSGGVRRPLWGQFSTDLSNVIGTWDDIYIFLTGLHNKSVGDDAILNVQPYDYDGNLKTLGSGNSEKIVTAQYDYNSLPKYIAPQTDYPPAQIDAGSNIEMHKITDNFDAGDWATLNYNRFFQMDLNSGAGDYDIAIYYMGICFSKTIPLNEQSRFFFNAKGRMFTGGWYARKTPTDLVEGPSEVVECILRDDLGITNVNDLDMSNFDYITSLERVGWKMAFQQIDKIESLDLIKNICQETGMIYHKTPTGKHSLKVIDPSTTTKRTITTSDILKKSENESSFEVKFSPSKYIYNEYFVHYKKDPATGDYNGFKYVKNSHLTYDSSYTNLSTQATAYHALCAESYGKYGRVLPKHYYLDYIRDDSTAEKFLKKMCVFHYLERAEPEFDTQLQMMALELGDKVQMGADILEGSYFITEYSEDMNADQMHFKLRDF